MEWKVGSVRIVKVVEHELPVPIGGLLREVAPDAFARFPWLVPDFVDADGNALISIHGLMIDTGTHRILVDTCSGQMREGVVIPPMASPFLDRLGAAGFDIEDVDMIVCTHLHCDHVGWNTRLVDGEWVVTFPNARYLVGRTEWDHWSPKKPTEYVNFNDTVRPVMDAGAVDLVEVDHQICDEVRLIPTPGHTPGHVSVVVESGGERAVITGDMAHHPLQFALPDLPMPADTDSATAAATRARFLSERAEDEALVIGTHFAGRTAGRVRADGAGWCFDEP